MDFLDQVLRDDANLVYAWFEAMHTRIDMILWDRYISIDEIHLICSHIEEETKRIEEMASCFRQDSEVSRINSALQGEVVEVTPEMASILSRCAIYCRQTEGLFDISASYGTASIPLDTRVRIDGCSVVKTDGGVKLNLSGFLKGYALDRAVSIVRQGGLSNALISFGNSSVIGIGNHPGGSGWPVGTEGLEDQYVLHDECLTVSGNSSDQRMHIINPLTGNYIKGKGTVAVLTPTGEEGEVKSTVAFLKCDTETKQ